MTRFTFSLAILAAIFVLSNRASAAPGDWFEYTDETGDNDPSNILNWRWGHDTGMPGGVSAYGHPTSYAQLSTTRQFLSGSGSGFAVQTPNNYNVADIGNGMTFNLNAAQVDGGETLSVHGTGVLTATGGDVSANGLGLNVVRDMPTSMGGDGWGATQLYYRPVAQGGASTSVASGDKSWFGNNLDSTIHVYGGGTFTNTAGGSNTGINSGVGPIGHLGYDLDSTSGKIVVMLGGAYVMGSTTSNGTGGGFLTLRGYDPLTSIHMGSMSITPANAGVGISPLSGGTTGMVGNFGLSGVSTGTTGTGNVAAIPANYLSNISPSGAPLAFDSTAADLRVHLTSQNAGGLFDSVILSGALTMPDISTNSFYNAKPAFDLTLDGYTPVTGDEFSIITAGSLSGTGSFQEGWDTNFTLGDATYQLHDSRSGVSGVYLEVMNVASAPEPASFVLAALGGLALAGLGWKRRRATAR